MKTIAHCLSRPQHSKSVLLGRCLVVSKTAGSCRPRSGIARMSETLQGVLVQRVTIALCKKHLLRFASNTAPSRGLYCFSETCTCLPRPALAIAWQTLRAWLDPDSRPICFRRLVFFNILSGTKALQQDVFHVPACCCNSIDCLATILESRHLPWPPP